MFLVSSLRSQVFFLVINFKMLYKIRLIMTVANILTVIRLVLTPIFIVLFVVGEKPWAIVVFSIAGFTDLIDGSIARMLKQPSAKGALLDPMADKLLVQSSFFCLLLTGLLPLWFFLLALARDLMIVSGIFYLEYRRFDLPYRATWPSKFATLLQIAVAVLGLLIWWNPEVAFGGYLASQVFSGAAITTAFFLLVSGLQYVFIGLKIVSDKKKQHV